MSLTRSIAAALAAGLAGALTGCIPPSPEPTPAPSPAPTAAAAPAPVSPVIADRADDWQDRALTPGDWRYRGTAGESFAEFVSPQGTVLLQLHCMPDRALRIAAQARGIGGDALFIRTETLDRRLAADAREGWTLAALDPRDRLLDAMAFSNGRLAVIAPGAAPLIVPAWPEITRVIEDCRR